jgi:threonine dehydratase
VTTVDQPQLDIPRLVLEASKRCEAYLSPTPLEYSMYLSDQIDGEVWLKLDSMQRTASFTFRGAICVVRVAQHCSWEQRPAGTRDFIVGRRVISIFRFP